MEEKKKEMANLFQSGILCIETDVSALDVGMSWIEINRVKQRECRTGMTLANLSH